MRKIEIPRIMPTIQSSKVLKILNLKHNQFLINEKQLSKEIQSMLKNYIIENNCNFIVVIKNNNLDLRLC